MREIGLTAVVRAFKLSNNSCKFSNISIERRVSEGQYNAEYRSGWNPSKDEKSQISIAAQAISNWYEFSDLEYNCYSEWDEVDDEMFIVHFSWESFEST